MKKKIYALLFSTLLISSSVPAYAKDLNLEKQTENSYKIESNNETKNNAIFTSNKTESYNSTFQQTAVTVTDIKAMETEVIRLVNVQRSYAGLPKLKSNAALNKTARLKSQDMINKRYFSHMSPTYGSPFKMMETFGIRFSSAGENIAYGQKTPAQVMNSWMNSSGHRANILSPSYSQIGVGLAKNSKGVCYWTQQFIRPM